MEKIAFIILFFLILFTSCASNRNLKNRVSVLDFGAIPNDGVDDSNAIQKAVNEAVNMKGILIIPKGEFLIDKTIIVENGLRKIQGKGGVLKATKPITIFRLAGIHSGRRKNVSGLIVSNININANHLIGANGVRCFEGENCSNCQFVDNHFFNLAHGFGVNLMAFLDGKEGCENNIIKQNDITGTKGVTRNKTNARWYPVSIAAELDLKGNENPMIYYKKSGIAVTGKYKNNKNVIIKNTLDGGYYGISLVSSDGTRIMNNTSTNNVRNISLQWACNNNNIENNYFYQSQSSSILCGYGSSGNTIFSNTIKTDEWVGEALIKIGLEASGNIISKNKTFTQKNVLTGEYHIYLFIDSDNIVVSDNILTGDCSKAFIGVETAWNSSQKNSAHFGQKKGTGINGFAHRDMNNILIKNNTINVLSTKEKVPPAFYFAQIDDKINGSLKLNNCSLLNNTVNSSKIQKKVENIQMGRTKPKILIKDNVFFLSKK